MKPKSILRSFLFATIAISSASAANVTWDIAPGTVGVGNGTVTGGLGTWNTANGNWTADAGANNIAWDNLNNDTAIFGGTAGAVTLGANVTVGGLTFNTNSYSVTPGGFGINFGTPGDINVSTGTTNITAPISGSAITKTGGGALTLSTANTFSGLSLNGGTVNVNGATDSLGAADSTITVLGNTTLQQGGSGAISLNKSLNVSSGTLTFVHGNNSWTIQGAVSGSGTIKVNDAGSDDQRPLGLINTGNTSFTGAIDLINNRATIKVASLGDSVGSGNIIFGGNTSLFYLGTEADTAMTLTNRVFEFQGTTTTGTIANKNTASSNANTLTIDSNLAVTTAGAKTLLLRGANTGDNTFSGDIADGSGTVALSKSEAGKWILSGANSYTGGTSVAGGTLEAGIAGALGTGSVTVTSGTLAIEATGAMDSGAVLSLPSAATKNLTMNADQSVAALNLGGVPQPNGTYTAATNASAWVNGSATLTVGPAAAQPLWWDSDGATAGAGGATPTGTWGSDSFWSTSADGDVATAGWTQGRAATFSAGTDATGAYTVTVSGTQDIGGLTFEEGDVTLSGGTALRMTGDSLTFVNTGLTASVATPITEDATARTLTKAGNGALLLSGASDFSGLVMAGGSLQLNATVNLDTLTFTNTSNLSGIGTGALSFGAGGKIATSDNRYNQTITNPITGSPAVETKDFGAGTTYLGLVFAPDSGTQTLGAVLNPNNTGNTDKAGFTMGGSTTGNSVTSINYAGTDQYGTVYKTGTSTWTTGNITTGTVNINGVGGSLILNGTATGMSNGFVYTAGRLSGNASLRRNDRRGNHDFLSGFKVAPGDSGVGTITVLDGTTQTPTSVQQFTIFRAGSIYEWEVGASSQDTVHIAKGKLQLDGFTLNIIDAGATLVVSDQRPVFTYDPSVTVRNLSLGSVVFGALPAGWTGTPSLTDDGAGTIYITGLDSGATASPYDTWATGSEPFDGDANGDGVKDGLAFLLGAANPSENAIGRLPTVTESGGGLILTFNCLPVAARGTAALKVSHSNTLATWTPTVNVVPDADDAVPDNNVTFVVGAGPAGPPALNTVTATIDAAAAAPGKLFGRLEAEQP
jgi:fibronectin-binding autotransporter adhesin